MPKRKTLIGAKKVTMNFIEADYIRMAELYPQSGAQVAIRALVTAHVRRVDAKSRAEVEDLVKEIDLEDIGDD